jgi:hypothetical protein
MALMRKKEFENRLNIFCFVGASFFYLVNCILLLANFTGKNINALLISQKN